MNKELLAHRLSHISYSPSIAANALVAALKKEGRDIVNFTLGEPDLGTPANIVAATIEALRRGETHYTETAGTAAVRQAIVAKLRRDNGLDYALDEVIVGSGAKHVIFHAFAATLDPGDEVIVHAPYWVSYPDLAKLNGGVPVIIEGDEGAGFKLRPDVLELAITPRTKWFVLNSPNNPSGAVYSAAELNALCAVLKRHPHVLILADEIYEHFLYGASQHISIVRAAPDLRTRTLIVNGVSKSYAMTGWRLGFAAGPSSLIAAIGKLLSQTTTCANALSQAAAAEALGGAQSSVYYMRDLYQRRCNLMISLLAQVPGISCSFPEGAFYVFANVSGLIGRLTDVGKRLATDMDVAEYLLRHGSVAVVAGAAYGMSPYIRLSFACSTDAIRAGCARIHDACMLLTAAA